MSLWHKRMSEVTFADIDAFCTNGPPEDTRIEYKSEVPLDLGRTFAAMANTLGGLILLGVESKDTDNTPIWPPVKGMAEFKGIGDRLTNIANAVYPPVPIEVSPAFDIPGKPGKVLAVRVHQSPMAPHATDSGTRIYVRERDQKNFYKLAHIDRVVQMLNQRSRIDDIRKQKVERAIARVTQLAGNDIHYGLAWASVCPLFPWRDLCEWDVCRQALYSWYGFGSDVQTVPEGAISEVRQDVGDGLRVEARRNTIVGEHLKMVAGLEASGHVYLFHELYSDLARGALSFHSISWRVRSAIKHAQAFYALEEVQNPGYLQVCIGVLGAQELQMRRLDNLGASVGRKYVDEHFRAELTIPYEVLAAAKLDRYKPEEFELKLLDRLAFGFDVRLQADVDWCLDP